MPRETLNRAGRSLNILSVRVKTNWTSGIINSFP